MSRVPAQKGYRSFPPEYMTALERSQHLGPGDAFTLDFPRVQDALNVRRSFYRFRNALNDAAEADDTYAAEMAQIANRLVLNVEPFLAGFHLKFTLAPLVAAMRSLEAAEQKG